jgi:hypothetical protein
MGQRMGNSGYHIPGDQPRFTDCGGSQIACQSMQKDASPGSIPRTQALS